MNNRILCVDDDPSLLAGMQRNLRKQFQLQTATSGAEALDILAKQELFAVILADMQMPGMNGVELLKAVAAKYPDTVRIMLTGNADQKTAIDAVNEGNVFRFLNKPCPPEGVIWALEAGVQHHQLIVTERELLEKTLSGSIQVLLDLLAMCEPALFGRAKKMRDYMRLFIKQQPTDQNWELEIAAMLSQIAYVTVPTHLRKIVRSTTPLKAVEQELLLRLPEVGARLIAHIPRLEEVSRIIRYQEKNFDGSGFPIDSVAGEAIPIGARIIKVLTGLLELESNGVPKSQALNILQKRPGCYDTRVLDAAFACFDVYLETSSSAEKLPRAVRVKDLEMNEVLLSDVYTLDDILIAPAGTQISGALLERFRNFAEVSGIKEPIYVKG